MLQNELRKRAGSVRALIVAVLSLWLMPMPVAAATLFYQGTTFDTFSFQRTPDAVVCCDAPQPFRGPYDTDMRITAEIELDIGIEANWTFVDLFPHIVSATISDGINTFTKADVSFLDVTTNALGQVVWWNLVAQSGLSDYNRLSSSSVRGDGAEYYYEYPIKRGQDMICCGAETATAATTAFGAWSNTVQPVPLPASVLFLMAGVTGLALARRR